MNLWYFWQLVPLTSQVTFQDSICSKHSIAWNHRCIRTTRLLRVPLSGLLELAGPHNYNYLRDKAKSFIWLPVGVCRLFRADYRAHPHCAAPSSSFVTDHPSFSTIPLLLVENLLLFLKQELD